MTSSGRDHRRPGSRSSHRGRSDWSQLASAAIVTGSPSGGTTFASSASGSTTTRPARLTAAIAASAVRAERPKGVPSRSSAESIGRASAVESFNRKAPDPPSVTVRSSPRGVRFETGEGTPVVAVHQHHPAGRLVDEPSGRPSRRSVHGRDSVGPHDDGDREQHDDRRHDSGDGLAPGHGGQGHSNLNENADDGCSQFVIGVSRPKLKNLFRFLSAFQAAGFRSVACDGHRREHPARRRRRLDRGARSRRDSRRSPGHGDRAGGSAARRRRRSPGPLFHGAGQRGPRHGQRRHDRTRATGTRHGERDRTRPAHGQRFRPERPTRPRALPDRSRTSTLGR